MKKGDLVKIRSHRANRRQSNGATGRIVLITRQGIVYVQIGRDCPCFFQEELLFIEEVAA